MRNIFDQYRHVENRVTHALLSSLNEDRRLLASFLREFAGVRAPTPAVKLEVLWQRCPGETEPDEDEFERRGLPDGWIHDDDGWCLLIESKVQAPVSQQQLDRHRRTARQRDFEQIETLVLSVQSPRYPPGEVTVFREWREVYAWLCKHASEREWARRAAEFLEVTENRIIEDGKEIAGTLTMFAGFPFSEKRPYTYPEGKRLLRLALEELKKRRDLCKQLYVDPTLNGRPAITGRGQSGVWDFLQIAGARGASQFTESPHLTLAVNSNWVEAMVTVPNSVARPIRRRIAALGESGFADLAKTIALNMKPLWKEKTNAVPIFRGVQRRYRTQRSIPSVDAHIQFDLRTTFSSEAGPKFQPRWLAAGYGAFVNKEHSNYQIQFGALFPYDKCAKIGTMEAIGLIAGAWLACKPLVDLAK